MLVKLLLFVSLTSMSFAIDHHASCGSAEAEAIRAFANTHEGR